MTQRVWTCQRVSKGIKCGQVNPRRKQICSKCGKKRPATKKPAHMAVLGEMTYKECVERWGEKCGICGRGPAGRRLNRDHDHNTGKMRGLLCTRCNRALPNWMDIEWLEAAQAYVKRDGSKQ